KVRIVIRHGKVLEGRHAPRGDRVRTLMDADPTGIVGERPVAADAEAFLVADHIAASDLQQVLERCEPARAGADHADSRPARVPGVHQSGKRTGVAASTTPVSESGRSPAAAAGVSGVASRRTVLPSASDSSPSTATTWRRTYRT